MSSATDQPASHPAPPPAVAARVFIDGQHGTTGLDMRRRLLNSSHFELLEISHSDRRDHTRREELLAAADIAVLCLPDDAARDAAELVRTRGLNTRLLDASTAHRVDPNWVYGLPELGGDQRAAIAAAQRVSNPGCYPQGVILALRPLQAAGWLAADAPIAVHAISGYSGGGNTLIARIEGLSEAEQASWSARPYALGLEHKHLPEMARYSQLDNLPLFAPTVCGYYKGMLVSVTLPKGVLRTGTEAEDVAAFLQSHYADEPFIQFVDAHTAAPDGYLDPTGCNDTNRLELIVSGAGGHIMITARLDNLGKGAAGAAHQNLNLMCGLAESNGLIA